ncbi:DUF481 domain-containing protein [Luteimonas yindakuii]|uniref:DUF481 domain-containing protein n=1 Tax=Luteimonas yindakuii TaxID=2565782 RepID=A0A4Z1R0H6_9GAMM|nr:DUF481 domain-containing protein [Luteimonas yindakuii]QCO66860.2 DUF481 domain-containing protein [Luteimonas yindakuii]TKS53020.1 DUF481 domain-containing protein [Luteimonas yindakuii]
MIPGWWLAVVGLPVFTQPLPEAPLQPAPIALVGGQVSVRSLCYQLVCPDAEWQGTQPPVLSPPPPPGARGRVRRQQAATQRLRNRRLIGLYAPAVARDRVIAYARNWRVDTTYRLEAVREQDTTLRVEFGTGYRIEPYTDYGTAVPGLVARGGFSLQQRFGDRALWNQRVLFETGRENTYVRQTVGLDLWLADDWMLHSSLEMWHDTAANGGAGRTERTGSVRLRYAF